MYEAHTYEVILKRMLDRISNDLDKREGSVIYDALAPAAAELAQMYGELEVNLSLSFADTASGEYLERRTAEFGIRRKLATKARRKGMFFGTNNTTVHVPLGSRFSGASLTYVVIDRLSDGHYMLESEATGSVGNQGFGNLLPLGFVHGLERAELAEIVIPGEDDETDTALRERYLDSLAEQAFGGNAADYRTKIGELAGVGAVKVTPAWNGGGTVKCTLISAEFSVPDPLLISEVQAKVDPIGSQGKGLGIAPIGHHVTITGAIGTTINVQTTLTLANGVTVGQVREEIQSAIAAYLLTLRQSWKDISQHIVRINQIETRILAVSGIVDTAGTTINGSSSNLTLEQDAIPILGTVTLHVG
ncbi:baseplate J/gp47 family protein [Paenibacillus sp. L3-i20]|uniref:baseplate J/gp47 family protein n=1 Tax=Paenibacillus sp. L3-i20 TaxID=2905833 RepID=UPI001EE032C9|nr:baseplate J/gp47 family protein [Paenibacillus sp. L3-i20]GKU75651.1 phage tail protein [Paenibacillus sp. L3-i20]